MHHPDDVEISTNSIPKSLLTTSILDDRGAQYGPMKSLSELSDSLKETMRQHNNYRDMGVVHREALDMIMLKIARIVNGNPDNLDSWHDIAGYAKLVETEIMENEHD